MEATLTVLPETLERHCASLAANKASNYEN